MPGLGLIVVLRELDAGLSSDVRRLGGGSAENPSSGACHACSFGDTEGALLLPFKGGAFLSADDERTLGDVFARRNIGGEDLAEALFKVVVDLARVFAGVAGLKVGLEFTLEGEGARFLEKVFELHVEDTVLVGVRGPGLLREILCCSSVVFDPKNLETFESE